MAMARNATIQDQLDFIHAALQKHDGDLSNHTECLDDLQNAVKVTVFMARTMHDNTSEKFLEKFRDSDAKVMEVFTKLNDLSSVALSTAAHHKEHIKDLQQEIDGAADRITARIDEIDLKIAHLHGMIMHVEEQPGAADVRLHV